MTKDQTTKRPWIKGKDPLVDPAWTCIYSGDDHLACVNNEANASLIVHCVNVHDELVEALKYAGYAISLQNNPSIALGECILKIEQALAKRG